MEESPGTTVTPFQMRASSAVRLIRKLAANSVNLRFTDHALQRMAERDITDLDILRVLRQGTIEGDPVKVEAKEWQCKIVMRLKGNRDAGVVTIIVNEEFLRIRTVEWEDAR